MLSIPYPAKKSNGAAGSALTGMPKKTFFENHKEFFRVQRIIGEAGKALPAEAERDTGHIRTKNHADTAK
jgi:hypothetical protein